MSKREYDSTVARIAGNLLSGSRLPDAGVVPDTDVFANTRQQLARQAVALARAIVAETKRTEVTREEPE